MGDARTTRNHIFPRAAMLKTGIERVAILILIVVSLGCRSVYRFRCTSHPTQAGVVVGEEMQGETECTVEIPKNSPLIQDGKIEFTFCLQDGREKKKVVGLHGLEASNPVAEIASAPFTLAGFILLAPMLLGSEEDSHAAEDADEKDGDAKAKLLGLGAVGIGVMVIGAGVYGLFGGDAEAMRGYPVHVDFHEPVDVNVPTSRQDPPPPMGPPATNNGGNCLTVRGRPAGSSLRAPDSDKIEGHRSL